MQLHANKRKMKKLVGVENIRRVNQETDEIGLRGVPIWVRTRSSHCRGPFRWISTQQGVEVTSCLWYSAPQPFTKLMRMVHILVSSYTASKPWLTVRRSNWANSWLENIFNEQPGGILHTVVKLKLCRWLQLRDWTKMLLSERHSANTSPPT